MNQNSLKVPYNVAIILCGGQGTRLKSPLPKQFHFLEGTPVYLHTLKVFVETKLFDQIVIPVPKTYIRRVEKELSALYPTENITVIPAGSSRQESSYQALLACPAYTSCVVIHDGVRPFVSKQTLVENLKAAREFGAVDTCIASTDTLVKIQDHTKIAEIPKREEYRRGQTPQSFDYAIILQAHKQAALHPKKHYTDDCSLVLALGHSVYMVKGDEHNIKITTAFDLFLAEQLLLKPKVNLDFLETSLEAKVYVLTGASGGIGQVLSQRLKDLGATVIEVSKRRSKWKADLTDSRQVQELFSKIQRRYGPIDGLINAAGALQVTAFDTQSFSEIDAMIQINLMSSIYCCKCACIKPQGHIINLASSSYSQGRKEFLLYSSAKSALVNFTQGLAKAKPELFIHAIAPQRTDTPMRRKEFPDEDGDTLINPEQVAAVITKLLSTSSCSGSVVEVRKNMSTS